MSTGERVEALRNCGIGLGDTEAVAGTPFEPPEEWGEVGEWLAALSVLEGRDVVVFDMENDADYPLLLATLDRAAGNVMRATIQDFDLAAFAVESTPDEPVFVPLTVSTAAGERCWSVECNADWYDINFVSHADRLLADLDSARRFWTLELDPEDVDVIAYIEIFGQCAAVLCLTDAIREAFEATTSIRLTRMADA